ncbi:hypothetical protein CCP3SC15_1250003 [Gammaproteobacteria bacterium]
MNIFRITQLSDLGGPANPAEVAVALALHLVALLTQSSEKS